MQHFAINYWALVIATGVKIFIGMVWYSPLLFGKQWSKLVNCAPDEMKARMPKLLAGDFVSTFIMAFVLVHAVHYAGASSASLGAAVGFFNWLGFVVVTSFALTAYEKRPWRLFLINNGFQLLSLLAMGAIAAAWV
jgi:Protein of unknown function (DUF1761)